MVQKDVGPTALRRTAGRRKPAYGDGVVLHIEWYGLILTVAHSVPVTIYMGKDKVESTPPGKYTDTRRRRPDSAWLPRGVCRRVSLTEGCLVSCGQGRLRASYHQLSSAHVYLRMPEGMAWTAIPDALLEDCSQLVKANSIEGNKKNNITIIYTPHSNVKVCMPRSPRKRAIWPWAPCHFTTIGW